MRAVGIAGGPEKCSYVTGELGYLPQDPRSGDLLAMANGKVLAIELKGDSGYKVQPDQLVWQNRFAKSNTDYAVCKSLDEFKEKIREVFHL